MAQATIDPDRGADVQIDASHVPEHLRRLIALAARWAFQSQDDQDAFVERMLRERPADVAAFNAASDAHRAAIVKWPPEAGLDKRMSAMSEADWSHPYWHFLTLLKIRELTGPAP